MFDRVESLLADGVHFELGELSKSPMFSPTTARNHMAVFFRLCLHMVFNRTQLSNSLLLVGGFTAKVDWICKYLPTSED